MIFSPLSHIIQKSPLNVNVYVSSMLRALNVHLHTYFVLLYIYILSVVAIDETNISGCLHFLMQNIEMSRDLDRASRRSNVNVSQ